MAELVLKPRDPFEGMVLPVVAGVVLARSQVRFRLAFQATEAALAEPALEAGFATLPRILRAEKTGSFALLRPGPDEWLLLAEEEIPAQMIRMAGSGAIELSHGYAGIEWKGPLAAPALAAACPLDMHIKAFPTGMVTRTLYGKSDVLVWRQAEAHFHVEVARSYLTAIMTFFAETAPYISPR